MVSDPNTTHAISVITHYRVHILIFLFTLFIGLTIAHPVMELNDEWITLNQLNQLHSGHQVIVNEGKYGLWENGTLSQYFAKKSNLLGYSIALPLISLPAFWVIDITGDHFPFFILNLWTFLGILILVFVNIFFSDFTYFRKWCWAPYVFLAIFIIFFINLFYYSSFPVTSFETFPEIIAIVFTHCVLIALTAVMIFEMNRSIFDDLQYSFFGTVVTMSCSSYFVWMIGGKDHILTVFIFAGILLWLVKYQKTKNHWYFPLSFIFSGLLSWVRPELAFWVFLALCVFSAIIINNLRKQKEEIRDYIMILFAPFFTLIGALPFFTNNYMVTHNIFIPAWILWNQDLATPATNVLPGNDQVSQGSITTFHSVFGLLGKMIKIHPDTIFSDIFGVLFSPHNGGMGVMPLVPLFLVTSIIVVILLVTKKIQFTDQDKIYILPLALIAFSVFIAYGIEINSLNTSRGVLPDMRYLSPVYIPLSLLGLVFLKKIQLFSVSPIIALKRMVSFWIVAIPVSLILIYYFYSEFYSRSSFVTPLNINFSIIILTVSIAAIFVIIIQSFYEIKINAADYLIPVLCALPFIWQMCIVFYVRTFASGAGYTFWIPVVRIVYEHVLTPLLMI